MKKKSLTVKNKKVKGERLKTFRREFRRDWQLHLLILLPVIYLLIFHYWPIYGAQIAFRDYSVKKGILGSAWVGWKWFEKFLTSIKFVDIFKNTLVLSLYQILIGFPLPIIFALMINTMKSERFKKVVQTITYMPHFISVVVIVAIMNMVLSPINGIYGTVFRMFGGIGYPTDIRADADAFRSLYVWSGIWQNLGWDTIIYTAALSSVSFEQHEAAMLDGASRWQRVFHVDIPAILPTICIMLILRCGSVMTIGFEKVYLMQSVTNLSTAEVISTYVYKVGMGSGRDFSFGAAIGLFNSVINCILLVIVNLITKKLSSDDVSLF